MNGHVLFFDVANPGYLPVVRAIAEQGFTVILNSTPVARQAKASGVPFVGWESFYPADGMALIQKEAVRIARGMADILQQPATRLVFDSHLGSFLPITGDVFFRELIKLTANEIFFLEILELITAQCDLRLIVLGCDNSHVERAIVLYGAQKGIPTLQLAHGIYGKPVAALAGEMNTVYSDYIAAFGKRAKDILVEMGNSPDRIVLTGAPLWDSLYASESRLDKREARLRLGLDPDEPVVLFCTSDADGSSAFLPLYLRRHSAAHETVLRAVLGLGRTVQLLVRPHPNELGRTNIDHHEIACVDQTYRDWLSRAGIDRVRLIRDRKSETVCAADVVVVIGGSTIVSEVMILQRPAVILCISREDLEEHLVYSRRDGVTILDDDSQLQGVLAELLADPAQRDAVVERQNASLPDLNHRNDGRATERVIHLISELASRSGRASRPASRTAGVCREIVDRTLHQPKGQESATQPGIDPVFMTPPPEEWAQLDPIFTTCRRKLRSDPDWRFGPRRVQTVAKVVYDELSLYTTVEGKTYCDIGAGVHHPFGTSAVMFLNGAALTIAVDNQESTPQRTAEALYDLLIDCLADPDAWHWSAIDRQKFISNIHRFRLGALKLGRLKEGLADVPLTYHVGPIEECPIPAESVDVMSSQAVLEHFLDFDKAVSRLYSLMAPGGIAYHAVDLVDHRWYRDPSRFHMWSFLAEDDGWSDGVCNRLRHSEVRERLKDAGFELLKVEGLKHQMPEGLRRFLKGRFAAMPDEELEITGMNCVLRKPGPIRVPSRSARRHVLLAYRSDVDRRGGAATVMHETAKALEKQGVQVDITHDIHPKTQGVDLVHVFNIWRPDSALEQLRHLGKTGIPIVWSPIYLHWCELAWAAPAIKLSYDPKHTPDERRQLLDALSKGTIAVNDMSRWNPNEIVPNFHLAIREMMSLVDHVCVTSQHEAQMLFQITHCMSKPYTVTPHGVDAESILRASPDAFRSRYGIDDFVLCVGAIDVRKNQLMLIEALKGTGLQLVLVGPSYQREYLSMCLREGRGRVQFTDRLPQELVASAYQAARVHALPSFAEGAALANLEAAVAGCALVTSNRSSEFEYFGAAPYYCDPTDAAFIRQAVLHAYENRPNEKDRWETLSSKVQKEFTWAEAGRVTLEVYDKVTQGKYEEQR